MFSKTFRIAAGIVISMLFVIAAFYKIRLGDFLVALLGTNLINLLLCLFFFCISCLFRAGIWHITTQPLKHVSISTLFGGIMVGYMANNFLPLRAGELVRAHYLSARTDIPYPAAFCTVCIERVFDVLSLALLLTAGLIWGIRGLAVDKAVLAFTALWILVVAAVFITVACRRLNRPAEKSPAFMLWVRYRIKEFLGPVTNLKQPKKLFSLTLLSLAAWAGNYLALLVLISGAVRNSTEAALLLLLFINIGLLIPSSPGALGIIQVAFWTALAPFGVTKETAIALSIAFQAGLYVFTLAMGLPYYLRATFSFSLMPEYSHKETSQS